MRKRAVCILLVLVLSLAVLPAGAFAAHSVDIDEAHFPDPVFRQYVMDNLDTKIKDNRLSAIELNAATWVNVSGLGVKDLRGIEHLYALTALDCSNNSLTALDVSKNTELKELYCFTNAIKSLDVRKNTELQTLRCQSNKLTSLDLSKNTKLSYLNFAVNEISSVDLSKNTALTALQCGSNKLTSLDLSKNTALSAVECSSNKLTALDLSHCPALEMVNCCGNSIKTLDLRGCKALSKALRDTANVEYHPFTNACYIANNASGSYLAVTDYATAIRLGNSAMPKITAQPKNVKAASGKKAVFSVKATGKDLTYQWLSLKKGAEEYKKAGTKASLTVTAKPALNGAKYRCLVRNRDWILFSNAAKLTVVSRPKITGQTGSASVKPGSKVTFKVKATGGALKYQWYCMKPGANKWVRIAKATKASWTVKASKKVNGYKYRCLVYNEAGKAYSKAVRLTVK